VEPRRLNVGCGRNIRPGWINLDVVALPGVDIVADLDRCADTPIGLEDDSIDEFLLSHLVEHIRAPLPMMQELHRIAKPGALAVIRVPHGASDDAWEDPTHVRAYFIQSFIYFSQPTYWRADYGYRGDWQPEKVILAVRSDQRGVPAKTIFERAQAQRNVVQEMICEMRAIKPIRAPQRELMTAPRIEIVVADAP